MTAWPRNTSACPGCELSTDVVSYGGDGLCEGCKGAANGLERAVRALRKAPEGSDAWTLGIALTNWGARGVADACVVDVGLVAVWVRQGMVPQPHRAKVHALWRDLSRRDVGWGMTAAGKSGRQRTG